MHLDVIILRNFYYRTRLGRAAQRSIRNRVLEFWPNTSHETIAGFGFAQPLLRPFLKDARRVIGLMPAQQGVMHWPAGGANISVLCEENRWPLQTGVLDKLVVMHGLETSEYAMPLLSEAWRVLGPGGRALFIVPNRAGIWARSDQTPFGYGRPYSIDQLENQLEQAGFMPESHRAALFHPPFDKRFWLRTGPMWDRIGGRISTMMVGGVLMVEVSKQVYGQNGRGSPEVGRIKGRILPGLRKTPGIQSAYLDEKD